VNDHKHRFLIRFVVFNVHTKRGPDEGWYRFVCMHCHEVKQIARSKFWR
jgi:hypothetical protein